MLKNSRCIREPERHDRILEMTIPSAKCSFPLSPIRIRTRLYAPLKSIFVKCFAPPMCSKIMEIKGRVGDLDLQHINTNIRTTDIFTNSLGTYKLRQFTSDLGLTTTKLPSLRGSNREQGTN